jgi:hypothetical protein
VLAAWLAAQTLPQPPLGEVRGTPAADTCTDVLIHANAAIGAVRAGDDFAANAIARLRGFDPDGRPADRRKAMADLGASRAALAADAARATDESERVRRLAARSAPSNRDAAAAFATALAAAASREARIAADLDAVLRDLSQRDIRGDDTADVPLLGGPHVEGTLPDGTAAGAPGLRGGGPPLPSVPHPTASTLTRLAADTVETDLNEARADEARAALHSEEAVRGC